MAIISGVWAALVAEVYVSNAAVTSVGAATYVAVEKVNSPRLSGTNDTAESSNNDSGGQKEFVLTWGDGQLSFEIVSDESATAQEYLWTALLSQQLRAFKLLPHGVNVDNKRIEFLGLVTSIEQSLDKGDVAKYTVTVKKTGAFTRAAQV